MARVRVGVVHKLHALPDGGEYVEAGPLAEQCCGGVLAAQEGQLTHILLQVKYVDWKGGRSRKGRGCYTAGVGEGAATMSPSILTPSSSILTPSPAILTPSPHIDSEPLHIDSEPLNVSVDFCLVCFKKLSIER